MLRRRSPLLATAMIALVLCSRLIQADTGVCGGASITLPFTDVQAGNIFFCSIAEAYFSGLTNGTSSTAYNLSDPVPREQMAAFITRTQDSALKRGSRRASSNAWWTPTSTGALRAVDLGANQFSNGMFCDGEDVWVSANSQVKRVHASDGKVLQTWTGATSCQGIIAATGRIFIVGYNGGSPGKIFVLDPAGTPGNVSVFESDIGIGPVQITFDGTNLWTANQFGSITRVDVSTAVDSTFNAGLVQPLDILWDGANLWVADGGDNNLKRINVANGSVLESIPVPAQALRLLFDGTNVWVSSRDTSDVNTMNITVVRAIGALRGTVLATLSGGVGPFGMAFDGERVLVCDHDGNKVVLFKAADLTPLGSLSTGANSSPAMACSDGLNFWIGPINTSILRF